ncbi:MAG: family 43 glycosylhydrolase [bacterium]
MPTTVSAGEFTHIYDPSIGESEPWYINDHTFIRDQSGTWHLFGITHPEPFAPHDEKHLAHATAPSLHGPWTKQPFALSADPAWGETQLWAPHVIFHDGQYWMFVCAGGPSHLEYRIHLATSPDCWTWTRHPENPLIIDGYEARDPMVIRIDDRWIMYYTATTTLEGGNFVVVAAESDDLIHWSGRRIVYSDEYSGTFGGPCESPFVVAKDGSYYLFIGPDWDKLMKRYEETGFYGWSGYRGTRVIQSTDPLHFDVSNRVGFLDSHASEVIVDEHGAEWLSHCGWGQGGVHVAPLGWSPGVAGLSPR